LRRTRVRVSTEVPWERHKSRSLERSLGRMMRKLNLEGLELSVVLVGDNRIRELNREYLAREGETDVLAFPMLAFEEKEWDEANTRYPELLGDIVICLPVAVKQAEESGVTDKEEIEHLAAHGLLHLVGFDDETPDGAIRMREKEIELIGRSMDAEFERE
jgi:probable rRNA maturation factor